MQLLERYIQLRLSQLGYPGRELDVKYTVGFTQGDDVVVSGRLDVADLKSLAVRKLTPSPSSTAFERLSLRWERKNLQLLLDFVDKYAGINVKIDCQDTRHPMYIESGFDLNETLDVIEGEYTDDYEHFNEHYDRYEQLWELFLEWIQDDIRTKCRDLLSDAHDILGALSSEDETLWTFDTKQYRVTVTYSPDEGHADYGLEYWDEAIFMSTMQQLISGEKVWKELCAEVIDIDTEEQLGVAYRDVLLPTNFDHKAVRQARNQVVDDVIALTRNALVDNQAEAA